MSASTKLIIALDFDNKKHALDLVNQLEPNLCALKIGSEMFILFGLGFVQQLIEKGFKVFLDLKFFDIPNTVAQACKACASLPIWMITVHAMGGIRMMQAARAALTKKNEVEGPLLIAVTVLTSMKAQDLNQVGFLAIEQQVQHLALLAKQGQCDGVVCSAQEIAIVKEICGSSFLTITPGIRFPDEDKADQERIVSPAMASQLGSDYIVVGRSITQSSDPSTKIKQILSSFD